MTRPTQPSDPARSRKVFWIKLLTIMALSLVAVFVLYRYVAIRALNQRIAAVREAGYPIDLAELDAWYKVPEGKNAADVYLRAFAAFPLNPDAEGIPIVSSVDYVLGQSLDEDMKKRIEDYLALHAKTIALLEKAAGIEGCRFPIDLKEGYVLLPQLGQLRRAARTLKVQSILDVDRGDYDLAADRCVTMIALARSLENDPILISSLVSIANQGMTYEQIELLVAKGRLGNDTLRALTKAIEPIDFDRMFLRTMVGERCWGHGIFNNSEALAGEFSFGGQLNRVSLAAYRTLGLLDIDHSCYLDVMQAHLDFAEHPTWPMPASLSDDDQIPRICVVTRQLIPALSAAYKAFRRSEARRRTVLAGIAAERYRQEHGALPAQLEDLTPAYLDAVPDDPFDGQPLRYRLEDTAAIIYSIGVDGNDDGGRRLDHTGREFKDGTDIPFTFGGLQEALWPRESGEGEQPEY